jgi:integrase
MAQQERTLMSKQHASARERVEPGVWRRGDTYEITFRDAQGKQRRRTVQGGLMAARKQLAAEVAKRATGGRAPADPRLTLNRAADAWYEEHVVANLRPASQSAARTSLKHLRAAFGSRRLTAIEPRDVAVFVRERRATGAADNSVRANVNCLSGIFRFAARHLGYPGANPVGVLDRHERPTTEPERETRALASTEIEALMAATLPADALLVEFALATGMRQAEILGLAWGDLDLSDAPAVTVVAQLGRHGADRDKRVAVKSKRGYRRRIVITRDLARKLIAHKLLVARSGDEDLVFTSRVGEPRDHRVVGRAFVQARTRAGIEDATFHWMRHTHGSQLVAAGWDIAAVAARLGDSIATVQQTYVHEFDAARREHAQREQLAAMAADGSAMAARGGTDRALRVVGEAAETAS